MACGMTFSPVMALYGDFRTFHVTDLLQWIESTRKSGVIEFEQNRIKRAIVCREGRIVACTSDDPATRLGQSLLAKGRITETQLQVALQAHETTGKILGEILVEQGAVEQADVDRHVAAKAEEAIYSLFDQDDTFFQFDERGVEPDFLVHVDLRIQDVLLKGCRRYDEMQRIRNVFRSNRVVLSRTDRPLPARIAGSRVSMRLVEAVNGVRTLEEILLHTRGSEYLVTRFLYELHRKGFIEVTGEQPAPDTDLAIPLTGEDLLDNDAMSDVSEELDLAARLVEREEHETAIAVLQATARAWPGVPSVRRMIERVEAEQYGRISREIPSQAVPVLVESWNLLPGKDLTPGEAYLTTLIDGRAEVRSILWVAPMRALDVLRNLKRLLDRGAIRMADAGTDPLDAPLSLPEDNSFGGVDGGQG